MNATPKTNRCVCRDDITVKCPFVSGKSGGQADGKCNVWNPKPSRRKHCRARAGRGTTHVGTGPCHNHGGSGGKKTHGMRSKYSHVALGDRIVKAKESGDLMKFADEIALTQAILEDFLEKNEDLDRIVNEKQGSTTRDVILFILTKIATIKERAHKVESAWTDTRAEAFIRYIGEINRRVLQKELPDDTQALIPAIIERIAQEAEKFHP